MKLSFVLIGAGRRGQRYTENAFAFQDAQMNGMADPNPYLRDVWSQQYGCPKDKCFGSYEELFALGKIADFAIIATQDRMHYEPTMMAIELGYDILLEKPLGVTPQECFDICNAAKKKGVHVLVCHTMRYKPVLCRIKEIVDSGALGRIMNVQHAECVGNTHYSHAFVRGPWKNSRESSDMLLAKSCHDMDFLQWLIGEKCRKVQSFGSLSFFRPENCPQGAPERCIHGCPASDTCPYDAVKLYRDFPIEDGGWWKQYVSHKRELSSEEIDDVLRNTDFGKCVFRCGNDVVDHQIVNLEYENGTIATFTMSAFNVVGGRRLHIMGTKGELICPDMRHITVNTFCDDSPGRLGHSKTETYDVTDGDEVHALAGYRDAGDIGIVRDLWQHFGEADGEKCTAEIDGALAAYMTIFAAEESRKNGGVMVEIDRFMEQFAD